MDRYSHASNNKNPASTPYVAWYVAIGVMNPSTDRATCQTRAVGTPAATAARQPGECAGKYRYASVNNNDAPSNVSNELEKDFKNPKPGNPARLETITPESINSINNTPKAAIVAIATTRAIQMGLDCTPGMASFNAPCKTVKNPLEAQTSEIKPIKPLTPAFNCKRSSKPVLRFNNVEFSKSATVGKAVSTELERNVSTRSRKLSFCSSAKPKPATANSSSGNKLNVA